MWLVEKRFTDHTMEKGVNLKENNNRKLMTDLHSHWSASLLHQLSADQEGEVYSQHNIFKTTGFRHSVEVNHGI